MAVFEKLNDEEKLVAPLFGPMRYSGLKQVNCFGFVWPSGTRVLGESSGGSYGLELVYSNDDRRVNIGLLYADAEFLLEGKRLPAGPYFVFAAANSLRLMTETRPPGAAPLTHSEIFPLAHPLEAAQLEKDHGPLPRFTLVAEDGKVFLELGQNRLLVSVP